MNKFGQIHQCYVFLFSNWFLAPFLYFNILLSYHFHCMDVKVNVCVTNVKSGQKMCSL